ncbi:MAG TPA: hypothetical protein VIL25_04880, partial [Vicinamibacterales bacterium]
HDAPPAMALALIVLAIGSVVAGFVGVPPALGGSNAIEHYLEPSFGVHAPAHAAAGHGTELALMALSVAVALAGIGLAWHFFLRSPRSADRVAESAAPVHRLLLNKYYVDEPYDAVIVRPLVALSRGVLWKGIDAGVIDGAVNGAGGIVQIGAGWLRRLQTGSVKAYAASLMLGVVLVLGYYVWRYGQTAAF